MAFPNPIIGEIRIMSFNFPPKGWAQCNGAELPISQNQYLFQLLGTTYGGNGTTNFKLPDLRDRAAMCMGNGHVMGESAGEANHTLSTDEMAMHTHVMMAKSLTARIDSAGRLPGPSGALAQGLAAQGESAPVAVSIYGTGPVTTALNPAVIGNIGGGGAHENRQPFLTVNFCIALVGSAPF
jgi:microcystin-dependent protein